MSSSYTIAATFTRTNARYLGSKVAADLRQFSLHYGSPALNSIQDYLDELVELLAGGWLATYEFGFKQAEKRVLSYMYRVDHAGNLYEDGGAGGILPRMAVSGASYFNFLTYDASWWDLTDAQRQTVRDGLVLRRGTGNEPHDGAGYWATERTYVSGRALERRVFRPW
jgi:hypothetical protein